MHDSATPPDQPLKGRTAIVTGASRGIGKAIAQRLAAAGAHVILGARSIDAPSGDFAGTVHETAELIRAMGAAATPLAVDMHDPASRENFIAAALQVSGAVDILVNNAGTAHYAATWEYSLAEAMAQTEVYFTGPWHLCNLLLPQMIERREGWILNLGSSAAVKLPERPFAKHLEYFGHHVLYASLKAAVHRFTLGLAAEVNQYNIAVNAVAPVGGVVTPGLESLDMGFTPDHPACEIPEQIAEAALHLVSGDPAERTAIIAWSHRYLDEIGRSTRSLDGRTVLVER